MNVFTKCIDEVLEDIPIELEETIELVDHILNESDHITKNEYIKSNLTYDFISDHIIANEGIMDQLIEEHNPSSAVLSDSIDPSKLAYHLAFESTELGTQLLDELLYYRKLGRI